MSEKYRNRRIKCQTWKREWIKEGKIKGRNKLWENSEREKMKNFMKIR